jgi:hypothetical protein
LFFNTLTNEARQRLIDVQQRMDALRVVRADLDHRYGGSMQWRMRGARDYLYRRHGGIEKALGPRSPDTEAIRDAFVRGREAGKERESGLKSTLETMAPVNRAMGLGRVPRLIARVLRQLDQAGVLGEQICIVGTNALFAYEARAGIRFRSDLLATDDLDIALDARRRLALAARKIPNGLLDLIRKTDRTFAPIQSNSFRAINASGTMIDLITPEPRNPMRIVPEERRRLGGVASSGSGGDLLAVEVPRLELIVDAPRIEAVAVAEDGLPVWFSAADPRWWAAHKMWLAQETGRDAIKRQRDRDQALAVADMLAGHWQSADLSDAALAAIPAVWRQALRQAVKSSAAEQVKPMW